MKRFIYISLVVLLIAAVAVSYRLFWPKLIAGWNQLHSHEFKSEVSPMDPEASQTKEDASTVDGTHKGAWRIDEFQLSNDIDLGSLTFFDENIGFATSYDKSLSSIYKTSDGGRTWQTVGSLQDVKVDDITFTSFDTGFLIASKLKPSEFQMQNGSVVMKTIDGGKSWNTVCTELNAGFYRIGFNSDHVGVVVGRSSTSSPYDSVHLVLMSNDDGNSWQNIAERLNKIEVSPMGQVADYTTDLLFSKGMGLVVLSLRGKIYNTEDRGNSWSLVSKIMDEPPQTGIYRFGELDGGRFWLSGGTISIEGNWGVLAVMNNSHGWDRFRLGGYYFSDIRFLSATSVIAVGAKVGRNNFGGANDTNRGVILSSEDGGKTWRTVYESSKSTQLVSIKQFSESKYFILGDKGVALTLTKAAK